MKYTNDEDGQSVIICSKLQAVILSAAMDLFWEKVEEAKNDPFVTSMSTELGIELDVISEQAEDLMVALPGQMEEEFDDETEED